jgi:hypothetical protein
MKKEARKRKMLGHRSNKPLKCKIEIEEGGRGTFKFAGNLKDGLKQFGIMCVDVYQVDFPIGDMDMVKYKPKDDKKKDSIVITENN